MTNRTGLIRWQTGFIGRRTIFIRAADETSPLADEASQPGNETSPFGPYIFTKLAPIFFIIYFFLFFCMPKKV